MNKENYKSALNKITASEAFQQKTAELLKNPPKQKGGIQMEKKNKVLKFVLVPALAVVLVCTLLFSNVFSSFGAAQACVNLMDGVAAGKDGTDGAVSPKFIRPAADFSVRLFQKSVEQNRNSLISPVSVYLALGMTANGADGGTLKQFENVLGGGLSIDELNKSYAKLANQFSAIKDGKLEIANSIWYRNKNLTVEKSFLQKNADYFGAGAFQLDFSKKDTPDIINSWVKEHTGGKIDKMVENISEDNMMYLINALFFEADWMKAYPEYSVKNQDFHTAAGTVTVPFMSSKERYFADEKSTGMIKLFKDERFAFAAILPNEGISMKDYVNQMTGESFLKLMQAESAEEANVSLPKFRYDYTVKLNDPLKAMGLTDAFDGDLSDFSKMGHAARGNLYISEVQHKTFIQVDQKGTKAGAVTEVAIASRSAMPISPPKEVVLDRPFVYAIIDTQTKLPIFIGTVNDPTK